MKKTIIYSIVLFAVLIFVGCEATAPDTSHFVPPPKTKPEKIETAGFVYNGQDTESIVFLPKNYQPNMPLVINLANLFPLERWMRYTRMNNVANAGGFIVVYTTGRKNAWDWLHGYDVGFFSALIDTIEARYDIDMTRVYCAGGGWNTGRMVYRLVADLGHRLAAAAPVSSSLFDEATNWKINHFTPLLIINGTSDHITNYYGGSEDGLSWSVQKTINFWLQNNKCSLQADTLLLPDVDKTDNSTIEKISWTNCSDNSSIVHYKVINGAHHWPGGDPDLGGAGEYKNNDINSSAEMWNFFKNYSNPLAK